jgi:iron-sulfur cluster repair protein YtfE (RIC family)
MLLLAQLLKKDAPPYRGLPTEPAGKCTYAHTVYRDLLNNHLARDRRLLFPFMAEASDALTGLCRELNQQAEELDFSLANLREDTDAATLDTLGRSLELYVRKKERELFQQAQVLLKEAEFQQLSRRLSQ